MEKVHLQRRRVAIARRSAKRAHAEYIAREALETFKGKR
jgi:hypothetical protein